MGGAQTVMTGPALEVLICTIGEAGIARVASHMWPRIDGVAYLVAWQSPGEVEAPQSIALRDDFRILTHETKGISLNRNFALANAVAPCVLMTDDDVEFTASELKDIMEAFSSNPAADMLTFMHHAPYTRVYPDVASDIADSPRGYYASAIEMGLRMDSVRRTGLRYNTAFGFHTAFLGGEDDVFLCDAVRLGMKVRFVPVYAGTHDHLSTSQKQRANPESVVTKGALMLHRNPSTWPLRMAAHAWRARRETGILSYIRLWLQGVARARKLKVFSDNTVI